MREDIKVIALEAAQNFLADFIRLHSESMYLRQPAHKLPIGGPDVGGKPRRARPVTLGDFGLHKPRAQHGNAEAMRPQTPAERRAQPAHGELRSSVNARARPGDE